MNLITDRHLIAKWLFSRFAEKHERMMPDYRALAAVDGTEILGAVVYDCFYAHDCNLSIAIASPRCVTRGTLRQVFNYPFKQLGLTRVSASVAADNEKSLRLMERWGFQKEGVKRNGYGHCDEILFGMLRSESKWI